MIASPFHMRAPYRHLGVAALLMLAFALTGCPDDTTPTTATPTLQPTSSPAPTPAGSPVVTATVTATPTPESRPDGLARPIRLTRQGNSNPMWSPEGDRIAFVSRPGGPDFYVGNADGSGGARLTGMFPYGRTINTPSWSPDGTRIVFVGRVDPGPRTYSGTYGIHLVSVDGSEPVRLLTAYDNHEDPVWSPDGTRIAFGSGGGLSVMDADGSGTHQFGAPREDICQTSLSSGPGGDPVWSPSGDKILFGERSLFVTNNDCSETRRVAGIITRGYSWAPDGIRVAYAQQSGIYVADLEAQSATRIIDTSGDTSSSWWGRASQVRWSDDGISLLFLYSDNLQGEHGIYAMNIDGSNARRVAYMDPYPSSDPRTGPDVSWSPDGRSIAYVSDYSIYVVSIDP